MRIAYSKETERLPITELKRKKLSVTTHNISCGDPRTRTEEGPRKVLQNTQSNSVRYLFREEAAAGE